MPFEEIVAALVNMIRETSTISVPVMIEVVGGLGDVAAEVATPLAVAIAELLQNAVEHAFPEPWQGKGARVSSCSKNSPPYFASSCATTGAGCPRDST